MQADNISRFSIAFEVVLSTASHHVGPGTRIDIWVVDQPIAAGGMGSVYRCHNVDAPRILAAVKVLMPSLCATADANARFVREAEILDRLDHPNIVRVRNVRMDCDPPYLQMEFVHGLSLEDRIARGPMPLREALSLMLQIADALVYLHERKVCHRDIKPANLLLTADGHIKLVDFGLAMETESTPITDRDMLFGTPAYAPPEWIRPSEIDPVAWDVYAFGVVLHELITGKLAFPASGIGSDRKQAVELMLRKQGAPPLDPGPPVPDALRDLVRRLTHGQRSARPQSMLAVREQLRQLQGCLEACGWNLQSLSLKDTRPLSPSRTRTPAPMAASLFAEPAGPARTFDFGAPVLRAPAPRRASALALAGCLPAACALTVIPGLVLAAVAMKVWVFDGVNSEVVVPEVSVPVSVQLAGRPPVSSDDGAHHFRVPEGTQELVWVAGHNCGPCDDPAACPPWCGTGREAVEVEEGGRYVADIDVPQPRLTVRVPSLDLARVGLRRRVPWPLVVTLDQQSGSIVDGERAVFSHVTPGVALLTVAIGACETDDLGCWSAGAGTCPSGCRSMRELVTVPWDDADIVRAVRLPVPSE